MAHDPGPPPTGQQTVVLDAVDVSARVTEAAQPVCEATPCAVHLERGRHFLHFADPGDRRRHSFATIDVGATPIAYRHALGHSTTSPFAIVGFSLALAGIGLAAIGGVNAIGNPDPSGDKALAITGGGMLLTGLVVWMLSMGKVQHGSGVQWTPIASPLASQ
jgi:hypothetical protein